MLLCGLCYEVLLPSSSSVLVERRGEERRGGRYMLCYAMTCYGML